MKVQIPKDKYFNIKTSEEMVEVMKDPIVAAINMVIDRLQNRVDTIDFLKKDRELTEKEADEQKSLANSIVTYEELKTKILNNQKLSAFDFNMVALICSTTVNIMDNQIDMLKGAREELSKIAWKIVHSKFNKEEGSK